MASFTEVQQVADNLGRPISDPSEVTQVQKWIDRVESRIGRRITDLDERTEDPDYLETFTGVVVDVVSRRALNPTGMRSERIDDYYYDRSEDSARADLWPTAAEWRELGWWASSEAFSTRPGFVDDWGRQGVL